MSSFNRRLFLLSLTGLAACGFTPAYGPQGGAQALQGRISLPVPKDRADFLLNQRLDEKFGHADNAPFLLTTTISTEEQGIGQTVDGKTTRFHLIGSVNWALRDAVTDTILLSGSEKNFTGYSTTGSTVATVAAQRDATARLLTILADQIADQIIAQAADIGRDAQA